MMSEETTARSAMKLALRSLRELVPDDSDHAPAIQGQRKRQENAIKALQEALASEAKKQPAQQEPVATDWERIARVQNAKLMAMCDEPQGFEKLCEVMDRYERTSPPAQRTWVGLTDAEANKIYKDGSTFGEMMRMVEAKLRSKNEDRN